MKFRFIAIAAVALSVPSIAFAADPLPSDRASVPSASATAPTATPAEPTASPSTTRDDAGHAVSLTFSPLHLILPEFKAMAEARVSDKVGLAVLGGIGSIPANPLPAGVTADRFTVWEVGAQARYYLVGTFEHGMELGAQAEYVGVSGGLQSNNVKILGSGNGFAAGPFIGYKLATKIGFTLDLQAGAQVVAIGATAEAADGRTASTSGTAIAPLVNLHIGWSF